MSVRIVRLGSPRHPSEGLRIGTVRHPPRGVPKGEYASRDLYDVWFPNLAPSAELIKTHKSDSKGAGPGEAVWKRFVRAYRAEMSVPDRSRELDLLAALSRVADFSVGCYCAAESRCHRSALRLLLRERGAEIREPDPG